jgi:hypothetical protein
MIVAWIPVVTFSFYHRLIACKPPVRHQAFTDKTTRTATIGRTAGDPFFQIFPMQILPSRFEKM